MLLRYNSMLQIERTYGPINDAELLLRLRFTVNVGKNWDIFMFNLDTVGSIAAKEQVNLAERLVEGFRWRSATQHLDDTNCLVVDFQAHVPNTPYLLFDIGYFPMQDR